MWENNDNPPPLIYEKGEWNDERLRKLVLNWDSYQDRLKQLKRQKQIEEEENEWVRL